MKTRKETFDEVMAFMRRQARPSFVVNEEGVRVCRYHGPDGLRCAAGCLSDEPFDEGRNSNAFGNTAVILRAGHDPEFVRLLQCAHDSAVEASMGGDKWLVEFERRAAEAWKAAGEGAISHYMRKLEAQVRMEG